MSEPIYKLFLVRPRPEWYKLSKGEQDALLEKVKTTIGKVGGNSIIICGSSWASEQWSAFGVEEYPSLDAVKKHDELLAELHWPYEYLESFTILGSKVG